VPCAVALTGPASAGKANAASRSAAKSEIRIVPSAFVEFRFPFAEVSLAKLATMWRPLSGLHSRDFSDRAERLLSMNGS
jgi:hypothetical protein